MIDSTKSNILLKGMSNVPTYNKKLEDLYKQQLVNALLKYKFFPGCLAMVLANISKYPLNFFDLQKDYEDHTEKILSSFWRYDPVGNVYLGGHKSENPSSFSNSLNRDLPIYSYFSDFYYCSPTISADLKLKPVHHIFSKDKTLLNAFKKLIAIQETKDTGIDRFLVPAYIYLTKQPMVAQTGDGFLAGIKYVPQYQQLSMKMYKNVKNFTSLRAKDLLNIFYTPDNYGKYIHLDASFTSISIYAIHTPAYLAEHTDISLVEP